MRSRWERLGLRGRLTLAFGTIVVVAFGLVFVTVRAQMAHERTVIGTEEKGEAHEPGATQGERDESDSGSPIEEAQHDVEKTFLLFGAIALAAALLAGYLVSARAAAPLRRFAATATEIDAGDLSPRIVADPSSAAELRTLADSFNLMLDRLEDAFARQRGFVSDASHELRSPLTAIRGQIEVLAREPEPDAAAVKRVEAVALTELARVERLVEQMLALARLDEGVGPVRHEVDAAVFLRESVSAAPGSADARRDRRRADRPRPRHGRPRDPQPDRERAASRRARGDRHRLLERRRRAPTDRRRRRRPGDRARRARAHLRPLPPQRRCPRPQLPAGPDSGLAIARSIVEAHGGRIWAEDSPSRRRPGQLRAAGPARRIAKVRDVSRPAKGGPIGRSQDRPMFDSHAGTFSGPRHRVATRTAASPATPA